MPKYKEKWVSQAPGGVILLLKQRKDCISR